MPWLLIKALLSGWLGKAWSFLCHRSFWQLTTMAAVALFMVQHFELAHERKNAAAYQAQAVNYKRQIETLQAQSKVQQVEVAKTVDHYITVEKPVVRTIVQKIESAPLPGNCGTPKEVRDADV
jgi:hypothetical protein